MFRWYLCPLKKFVLSFVSSVCLSFRLSICMYCRPPFMTNICAMYIVCFKHPFIVFLKYFWQDVVIIILLLLQHDMKLSNVNVEIILRIHYRFICKKDILMNDSLGSGTAHWDLSVPKTIGNNKTERQIKKYNGAFMYYEPRTALWLRVAFYFWDFYETP